MNDINELTLANKRLQDIVDHLNTDIKLQTDKFRENEKGLRDEIASLEAQVKSTQTEQFMKLKYDNKKLIQESTELYKENAKLREKNKSLNLMFDKVSREEELVKNSLLKELEELQNIRSQLDNELKRIEIEKYVLTSKPN